MKNRKSENEGLRFTDKRTLHYIHVFLGLILLAAGTLKLYDVAFAVQERNIATRLLAVLSVAEVLAGIWLLSGHEREQTRPWVIAIFAGFWASSLYHSVIGRCSCGCFGSTVVNPWLALVMETAAVAILLSWKSPEIRGKSISPAKAIGLALTALLVGIAGIKAQSLVSVAGIATWNGRPLPDSRLVFRGNRVAVEATTDHEGFFHLPPVRPGQYAVTANVPRSLWDPNPDLPNSLLPPRKVAAKNQQKSNRNVAERDKPRDLPKPSSVPAKQETVPSHVRLEVDDCSTSGVTLHFKYIEG